MIVRKNVRNRMQYFMNLEVAIREHKLVNNWRILFCITHIRAFMYKSSSYSIYCIIWFKNWLKRIWVTVLFGLLAPIHTIPYM